MLNEPEVPPAGEHILMAFWAMSSRRSRDMEGPSPLSFVEMGSYMRLLDHPLAPAEVSVICELDHVFMTTMQEPEPSTKWVVATAANVKKLFRAMRGPGRRREQPA